MLILLFQAVKRLGGIRLYDKSIKLKTKFINQSSQEIMLDIKRSTDEIKVLKQQIEKLKKSHKSMLTLIQV